MVTGIEKLVISFVLAVALILNISIPVIYAIERAEDKTEPMPYCSFFCNLSPSMAKNSEKASCPHHLMEIKKKRLTDHFQCKISSAKCHDNAPAANTSTAGEPYLLSEHSINSDIAVTFLDFSYSTISSQMFVSFLERPPSASIYK